MVVYKVLSIYRFLPGFREFAFFEKSKRFFYNFFLDRCYIEVVRALARAQIRHKTARVVKQRLFQSQESAQYVTGTRAII